MRSYIRDVVRKTEKNRAGCPESQGPEAAWG